MEEEIQNQILWFEALEDCIKDGEIEVALETVAAAIKLLKRSQPPSRPYPNIVDYSEIGF